MGINIVLYRATENDNGSISFVRDSEWSSIRQGIDKEVNSELEKVYFSFKTKYYGDYDSYWRPKDFQQAELWCWDKAKELGMDNAHDRWVQIFRRIKDDSSYWFSTSY